MNLLPRLSGWWLLLGLAACSENFGIPPVPAGTRVGVSAEGFAGPVPTRAVVDLAVVGDDLWVATGKGIYRASAARASAVWDPIHPGRENLGGGTAVVAVEAMSVDPSGATAIHAVPSGGESLLAASWDGGTTYRSVPVPNILAGPVERILALPPTSGRPDGSFLAVQGLTVSRLDAGADDWSSSTLPGTPEELGVLGVDAGGAVAVAARVGAGWTVWRSDDAGVSFATTGLGLEEAPLAVLPMPGGVAVADAEGVHGPGIGNPLGPGELAAAVDLVDRGGVRRWALLMDTPAGEIRSGVLGGAGDPIAPAPADPLPATLVCAGPGAWIADTNGGLWSAAGGQLEALAFGGGELDWSALAVDTSTPGHVLLADRFSTGVWVGDPAGAMQKTSTPRFQSELRAVLRDPVSGTGLYAGSFGTFFRLDAGSSWQDRTSGQFSYLEDRLTVSVQTLAAAPGAPPELWMGAILNDGPYRSINGGFTWSRVHEGLGTPSSLPDETGLPNLTQVRRFVFVEGETWMAGFRGGVFQLDADDTWHQRNQGLPDLSGSPVDSCCFAPLDLQVDVRDLVAQGNGLLAATSWGVFRGSRADGTWDEASEGMTNRDVWALAVHPARPGWVLAAVRGTPDNPDWLFLSRDGAASWQPVASRLRGRFADHVVWSDPQSLELVVLLNRSGAWRMELAP